LFFKQPGKYSQASREILLAEKQLINPLLGALVALFVVHCCNHGNWVTQTGNVFMLGMWGSSHTIKWKLCHHMFFKSSN